jgi:hypothetical protein
MGKLHRWFKTFDLLPGYFKAVYVQWHEVLWGATVPAVIFFLWWSIGLPPTKAVVGWFVCALFLAGYYLWRADHVRLMPKFAVRGVKYQPTPTMNPKTGQHTGTSVYVQLLLKCLTEASVEDCAGHLKAIHRWSEEKQKWEETDLNESVRLGWSHGDERHSPITLEPDIERRLNVFFVHSSQNLIVPIVYPLPLRWESVFNVDDTFRFDITVRGKDCGPVNLFMHVKCGDTWDKPLTELSNQPTDRPNLIRSEGMVIAPPEIG